MKMSVTYESASTIVKLEGDFISEGDRAAFRERIRHLPDDHAARLVVDLAGVHFINSCGLGALLCALKTACGTGGNLCLTGVHGNVASIMNLTRLDTVFSIQPSVGSGIAESDVHVYH